MLRTACDRPTLWESWLPVDALVMAPELAVADQSLDGVRFFA